MDMKNTLLLLVTLLFIGFTTQAQQKLATNVKVPNIITKDATGKKLNLQKMLRENDRVLICFFRPVWCPICNKRTHELIERYEELKRNGVEVIAIYPSETEIMAQYVKDANIPFPVISDPHEKIYEKYSIERSMQKMQVTMQNEHAMQEMKEGMELFQGKDYKTSEDEEFKTLINADFVVKNKRLLETAYYGEYVGDHYDLDGLSKNAAVRY